MTSEVMAGTPAAEHGGATDNPQEAPMDDIRQRYLDTWNATGEDRTRLLAAHWAEGATYVDPLAEVAGHAQLGALIDGVQQQFPGFVFSPVGPADGHHDLVRFRWGLGPAGDEPVVVGSDVVALDGEGRITAVRGFLDQVPA
jgi:hypothetical protein